MVDDLVFAALGSPLRREILVLLESGPKSAGEIASRFDRGRPAISEQLQILRQAHLVTETAHGRSRIYRLEPEGLAPAQAWIGKMTRIWNRRLDTLETLMNQENP